MKTLYIKDFGAAVNATADSTPAFRAALTAAGQCGEPCEILLETGSYHVYVPTLSALEIHVSNTMEEDDRKQNGEIASLTRHTPFLLDGMANVTIDGRGATVVCHGKMSNVILNRCENITLKNLTFDADHPALTEMTVVGMGDGYLDCRISADYPYKIENRRIIWYGDDYYFSTGISQLYNPRTGFTWRHYGPMDDRGARFEELRPGLVRLYYDAAPGAPNPYGAEIGFVFQMRDPVRDECGAILSECKNTTFENVTMHFMNGLGFIAQNCDGLHLDGFNAYPSAGRTTACSADFMHFSGCRGPLVIENGLYIGAHDDAINVHGTHLRIMAVDEAKKTLRVRFMHIQTYGIGGIYAGDTIGAIDPDTLLESVSTTVTGVEILSPREMLLQVASTDGFDPDLMIENISANAEVTIRKNHFERIPTRGILLTTRAKSVIEDNVFLRVTGCGVLMADDARSWYESGHVADVTIRRNTYTACDDSFVKVLPECVEGCTEPVHSGIQVYDNTIEVVPGHPVVIAKNTDGLRFADNILFGAGEGYTVSFRDVQNAVISGNVYNGKDADPVC